MLIYHKFKLVSIGFDEFLPPVTGTDTQGLLLLNES